jgi:hypothetical protein
MRRCNGSAAMDISDPYFDVRESRFSSLEIIILQRIQNVFDGSFTRVKKVIFS